MSNIIDRDPILQLLVDVRLFDKMYNFNTYDKISELIAEDLDSCGAAIKEILALNGRSFPGEPGKMGLDSLSALWDYSISRSQDIVGAKVYNKVLFVLADAFREIGCDFTAHGMNTSLVIKTSVCLDSSIEKHKAFLHELMQKHNPRAFDKTIINNVLPQFPNPNGNSYFKYGILTYFFASFLSAYCKYDTVKSEFPDLNFNMSSFSSTFSVDAASGMKGIYSPRKNTFDYYTNVHSTASMSVVRGKSTSYITMLDRVICSMLYRKYLMDIDAAMDDSITKILFV